MVLVYSRFMQTIEPATPDTLLRLLDYNPLTGLLFWKERPASVFQKTGKSPQHQANMWNVKNSGKEAFRKLHDGYNVGKVFGVTLRAHRVIWAMETGEWPKQMIDHINGNRSDNRWLNLREVDNKSNTRNCSLRPTNKSSHAGVAFYKRTGRWRAFVRFNYKQIHLGYFQTLEDAIAARKLAQAKLNFSERHGSQS